MILLHPAKQRNVYLSNSRPSCFPEAQNQGSVGAAHGLDFERKHDRLCFAGINNFKIALERHRKVKNEREHQIE